LTGPTGPAGATAGAANTIWNAADVSTFGSTPPTWPTLSNGNLTVQSGAGNPQIIRSTAASPGGKVYFEFVLNTINSSSDSVGLINGAAVLNSVAGSYSGDFIRVQAAGDIIISSSSVGGVGSAITAGQTVCVAVDWIAKRFWARIGSGNWNNSGTANPATNTGGIDISGINFSGGAYAMAWPNNSPAKSTTNFGASSFAQTVPSGFSAWNSLISAYLMLGATGQNMYGGYYSTPYQYATGNITVDFSLNPIQYVNNSGAFTITAPSKSGSCILTIFNQSGAGAVTFSGFTVGSSTGDALDTTSGHKFSITMWGVNGTYSYNVKALQ
jgi:hypothetical protein